MHSDLKHLWTKQSMSESMSELTYRISDLTKAYLWSKAHLWTRAHKAHLWSKANLWSKAHLSTKAHPWTKAFWPKASLVFLRISELTYGISELTYVISELKQTSNPKPRRACERDLKYYSKCYNMPQQRPLKEVYFIFFFHTLTSSVTYFEYSAANELALCICKHPSAYVNIRQHTRTWNKSPWMSSRSAHALTRAHTHKAYAKKNAHKNT
jgi:hypothetical protein